MTQVTQAAPHEEGHRTTAFFRLESRLARPDVQRWVAAACGAIAALVVLLLTVHGPGLTQDSATYEAAAYSLRDLKGAIASDGTPMVIYPPGYPAVLMVISLLGIGVRDAARVIGAASLGVIVTVTLVFVLPIVRGRLMTIVLVGAGTAAAGSLLMFATWQLSDVLLATIAFVVVVLLGQRRARLEPWVIVVAMTLAAAAPLVRYIGVALPVVVALVILDAGRGSPWTRLLRAGSAFALMAVPIGLWLARNYGISGTLTGARGASGFPADAVLQAIGGSILHWVVPAREALPPPLPALVGIVFILAIGALFVLTFRKAWVRPHLRPTLLFILVYLGVLFVSELLFAVDSVSDRFMLPVFVPVVLLTVLGVDKLAEYLGGRASPRLKPILFVLVLLTLVPMGLVGRSFALGAIRDGTGYFVPESRWTQSPLIQDLQTRWPGLPVYTNENAQVYLFAHRYAIEMSSLIYAPDSGDAQQWALRSAKEGALLVWLHAEPPQFPDVVVDGQLVRLEPVASYPDGEILRFVAAR